MPGEVEQVRQLVRTFNADAADRRAFAAAIANAYDNGVPLGPDTLAAVAGVMNRDITVAAGVTAVEAQTPGHDIFGPEIKVRPGGRPEGVGPPG
jgi:hypothetical protein